MLQALALVVAAAAECAQGRAGVCECVSHEVCVCVCVPRSCACQSQEISHTTSTPRAACVCKRSCGDEPYRLATRCGVRRERVRLCMVRCIRRRSGTPREASCASRGTGCEQGNSMRRQTSKRADDRLRGTGSMHMVGARGVRVSENPNSQQATAHTACTARIATHSSTQGHTNESIQ